MALRLTGNNHVNLTVRDLERSSAWYCRVLRLTKVSDQVNIGPPYFNENAYHGLFDLATFSYVVGLIQHPDGIPGGFDARRVGLDHVGFQVPERADLDDWAAHLDELGVAHSGVVTSPYSTVVNVSDPDGIALELSGVDVDFWVGLVERVTG